MKREKCTTCHGKKKLPTTYSAMYWPERFPNEFRDCHKCVPVKEKNDKPNLEAGHVTSNI